MNSTAQICHIPVFAALCLCASATLQAQEPEARVKLSELTLEEKASLVTGLNSWQTYAVSRLGIPSIWMADGPVGLRRSVDETKVPATCFPSSGAMAATWNRDLIERIGSAIGTEARFHDVTLLLGPGLNMKRHPLGGRNFEYYSEDPLLSGRTAAAFVQGVQSQGVGATLKHFAVNNQEYRRMIIDARVSERALREIYLRGFEIAVREGHPQAVMTAYNKVNGTSATQNPLLLKDILRNDWEFDGLVISDWGAMDDPAAAFAAGLDLEMPANPLTPPEIVRAVQEGRLTESDLDRAVLNVLQLVERQALMSERPGQDATDAKRRIGVLGRLAHHPRIQGIGSSQVNPTRVDTAWTSIQELGSQQGHTMPKPGIGHRWISLRPTGC